jgi:hypothetical protein
MRAYPATLASDPDGARTKTLAVRSLRAGFWPLPQALDPHHVSRMEQVEAAPAALGLRLIIIVARAASRLSRLPTNKDSKRKMKGDEIAACRAGLDPPFDYSGSRSALRLLNLLSILARITNTPRSRRRCRI